MTSYTLKLIYLNRPVANFGFSIFHGKKYFEIPYLKVIQIFFLHIFDLEILKSIKRLEDSKEYWKMLRRTR